MQLLNFIFPQVNSRFSAASVHYDEAGVEVSGLPQVYVAFQMEQYQLVADGLPLAVLNKLKLDAKVGMFLVDLFSTLCSRVYGLKLSNLWLQ